MAEDWRDDPFVDPEDPAARERAERRAEREAKRQQKEAKRQEKGAAQSEQQPPPEPPAPAEPPKPPRTPEQEFWDEDPEPEPEPEVAAPAAPGPEEPQAQPKPAEAAEPAPPAAPSKPEQPARAERPKPEPASEPVAAAAAAAAAGAAADPVPTPAPEPALEQAWEKEPPSTPDDDIWGDEGDPSKAGASGGGGSGAGAGGRRAAPPKRKWHPFRIAGIVVLFLVLWFVYALFQPFHTGSGDEVQVKIPKGASVSEVGDILLDKGVIMDPILPISGSTLFQMRVTLAGKRSELYAGTFTLNEDMGYGDAIDALSVPPQKRTLTVTVPEGLTRKQAAVPVEEAGVAGNYVKKTVKSKFLDPADYGGKGAESLEGFLFPNTYELKPKAPVADLVELQLKDFKRQIKKVDMRYAKSKNLTVFDVLIIASMIEDEAGIPEQRKQVAAVIYNRLSDGMPLGIDATIRFYNENWEEPLTESELNEDSPYNTRENTGLPPGPINSPGLAAIQAAAHPAKSDYLFYVNKPNACNELSFSTTEAEFEADVAAYNKAREENDGNEPSTC